MFIGWLLKKFRKSPRKQSKNTSIQQTASPTVTQTVHVHPPDAAPSKTSFQAAREQNEVSSEEAEERRLVQLEKELHRLIEEVKLISTSDETLCVSRLITAVRDICGFFKGHPDLRHRNLSLLKFLCCDDFAEIVKNEAREAFNPNPYAQRIKDSPEQHPCDAIVNPLLDSLLNLKARPGRTMKDYEDSLSK
jgi:hypothetical protein